MEDTQIGARQELSAEYLQRTVDMLRMLGHPCRLQVVEFLEGRGEAPVHAIADYLALRQASVSQHLARMKRVGLLYSLRKGKEVWYGLSDRRPLDILECIRKHSDKLRKAGREDVS